MFSKYQGQSQRRSPTKASTIKQLPISHDNAKQPQTRAPAMAFPLTPEQTPINRKKKDLDLISRTATHQSHSGRILFPTSSPAKGTGRTYKRPIDGERAELKLSLTACEEITKPTSKPRIEPFTPAKRRLDDCPSTNYTPEKRKFVPQTPVKKTVKTSPDPSPELTIFDDTKAFKAESYGDDPFSSSSTVKRRKANFDINPNDKKRAIETTQRHPYDTSIDPSVPGMWYNFRGKKVFRPFPKGQNPFEGYEPKVLFGPRKDSKSLEMSTTPIKRKSDNPFDDDFDDMPRTPSKGTDSFTARLMKSASKKRQETSQRATTPEINSEEESTDYEDNASRPQVVTATTTTSQVPSTPVKRSQPSRSFTPSHTRDTPRKHFFR